jgi:hypothetical protein
MDVIWMSKDAISGQFQCSFKASFRRRRQDLQRMAFRRSRVRIPSAPLMELFVKDVVLPEELVRLLFLQIYRRVYLRSTME